MLKLLYTIPTPFYDARYVPKSQREILTLLKLAKQNKVELLLLKHLDETMSLPYTFKERFLKLRKEYMEMMITANRIIDVLEKLGYEATTFKSWTPFLAVPNDIDVIILNDIDVKEFKSLIQKLINEYRYQIFDVIPYAVSIHDQRCSNHLNPKIKDPYDVDLYLEVAANKVIYLNKHLLKRHSREVFIDDEAISLCSLSNEHELLTQLTHCFLPEQIFLLYHYYISLYFLNEVNFQYFLNAAKKLHVDLIIASPLSITFDILDAVRRNSIVKASLIFDEFLKKGYYKFRIKELVPLIIDKMRKDNIFKRSLMMQITSLADVKTLQHFVTHLIIRRMRTTY